MEAPADSSGSRGETVFRRLAVSLRTATGIRIEMVLLVAAVVAVVALVPEIRRLERSGLVELSEMGAFAGVVLVAAYAVSASLLLPAFPLDLAAGAHFGFLQGVLWVQVAATVASMSGYLLGALVLRRLVRRLQRSRPGLVKVEEAVAREGWRIVFLTRLSPVFSFSILSGFYGAVRVPFWPYVGATFVGMLPGTALYVYAGELAGDLSGAPEDAGKTAWQWGLEIAGFVATAVVVVYVTRRAQKLLAGKLDEAA
jgi:uncharacterized membrane protein YdjX (TVP38/TMEM64 family)